MTIAQYNIMYNMILQQGKKIEDLTHAIESLATTVSTLTGKTIVVTNIDHAIEQLQLDVAALKDEKEA